MYKKKGPFKKDLSINCLVCFTIYPMKRLLMRMPKSIRRITKFMRFTNGYIKMQRQLIDEFEGDVTQLGLITLLMANVNWSNETKKYTKMGITYDVKYGQFITTFAVLEQSTGLSFRTLKGRLERLKKQGYISLESLNKCMLIALLIDKCQSTCSADVKTNEEYKKQEITRVSKDTLVKAPTNPAKNLPKFDSEGTKNLFDTHEDPKNPPPVDERGASNAMTPSDLMRLWNELSGPLPKCKVLSDRRKRQAKARIKENPSQEYWSTVIKKLAVSEFAVSGRWASFDWVVKNQENGDKAFNGNYDNAPSKDALKNIDVDKNLSIEEQFGF